MMPWLERTRQHPTKVYYAGSTPVGISLMSLWCNWITHNPPKVDITVRLGIETLYVLMAELEPHRSPTAKIASSTLAGDANKHM